jgi:D-alanine-D-alanine ligase
MKKKLRVALLFGGKSAEHEISLISARNFVAAMDKKKYEVVAIGIDKQGRWHLDDRALLLRGKEQSKVEFRDTTKAAAVMPGDTATPMVRPSRTGFGALGAIDASSRFSTARSARTALVRFIEIGQPAIRRRRCARFRGRHGQRRNETAAARRKYSDW